MQGMQREVVQTPSDCKGRDLLPPFPQGWIHVRG